MDAFLRTLTGDIFNRCPLIRERSGHPTAMLRKQLTEYVGELCKLQDDGLALSFGRWGSG